MTRRTSSITTSLDDSERHRLVQASLWPGDRREVGRHDQHEAEREAARRRPDRQRVQRAEERDGIADDLRVTAKRVLQRAEKRHRRADEGRVAAANRDRCRDERRDERELEPVTGHFTAEPDLQLRGNSEYGREHPVEHHRVGPERRQRRPAQLHPLKVERRATVCHRPVRPIPERRKIGRLADEKISGPADDASALAPYRRTGQQSKELTMTARTQDRLFAACGIAFVALELGGVAIGGKTHHLTVSSSATQVAHALAEPAGTLVLGRGLHRALELRVLPRLRRLGCQQARRRPARQDRPRRRHELRDPQHCLARRHRRDLLPRRPRDQPPTRRTPSSASTGRSTSAAGS